MSGETMWLEVLENVAVKGTVLLLVACGLNLALRRAPAATRHMIWSLAAAGLLLMPLLSLWAPWWEIPIQNVLPGGASLAYRVQAGLAAQTPAAAPAPASGIERRSGTASPAAPQPWPWTRWITLSWLSGIAVVLTWLLAGTLRVWWISRHARVAGPTWESPLADARAALDVRRPVRVLEAGRTTMPMTWGVLRPQILLPEAADEWPPERRRVVVLHELAHIKRGDCLTQVITRLACGLYWFHPLAWLAARQFLRERERASDDLVLAAGAKASDYAGHLLEVARSLRPAGAPVGVGMARRSQLEGRLLAILDDRARRGTVARSAAVSMAAVAACFVLALAVMRPARAQAPSPGSVEARAQQFVASDNYRELERLAAASRERLEFDQAVKLLRSALELREKRFGPESLEAAHGVANLAQLLSDWGKSFQAEPLWERALAIEERAPNADRTELASALYYAGVGAHIRHEYQKAEAFYQRALWAQGSVRGPNDPSLGRILSKLALLYEMQGRPADAELWYNRALAVESKTESFDFATTLEHYARLLRVQGRGAEADDAEQQARDVRKVAMADLRLARGADTSPVYRISPDVGVTAPSLISKVEPQYSDDARLMKYQATVVMSIEVGSDGRPYNIQLKKGAGLGLDEKAALAIGQWRFRPAMKEGQPVRVVATVEVNFRLL